MNWIPAENGEMIRRGAVVGVGKIKAVKVSSGKGESLTETTVYSFTIRIGTGATVLKSPDYLSEDLATTDRNLLLN